MNRRTLYTAGAITPAEAALFARAGLEPVAAPRDLDAPGLIEALRGCAAYVLAGIERASLEVLRACPDLRAIAFHGVDYHPYIDPADAAACGIALSNAPGGNAAAVAEFTLALLLELCRRPGALAARVRAGEWPEERGTSLGGKALGIVGAGAIGSAFAGMTHRAFGCRVMYCNRSARPELERETGAARRDLMGVLAEADVVSLHLPLTPETEGMIGAAEFAAMRPGALLVCTARAGLMRAEALRAALEGGRLRGVAMDGYFREPAAASDAFGLLGRPDVLVTPHAGYLTEEAVLGVLGVNLRMISSQIEAFDDMTSR